MSAITVESVSRDGLPFSVSVWVEGEGSAYESKWGWGKNASCGTGRGGLMKTWRETVRRRKDVEQ